MPLKVYNMQATVVVVVAVDDVAVVF